jgi:hypothetical protein
VLAARVDPSLVHRARGSAAHSVAASVATVLGPGRSPLVPNEQV